MNPLLVIGLRDRATLFEDSQGIVQIRSPNGTITFSVVSPAMRGAFRLLAQGASDDELTCAVAADDADNALTCWYYYLTELERRGEVTYEVRKVGRALARTIVMSPYFRAGSGHIDRHERCILSRFVYLHRRGDRFVLESPLSCARVELLDPLSAAMVSRLNEPTSSDDLAAVVRDLDEQTANAFLALLEHSGMVACVGEAGQSVEDDVPTLRTWHFADLLFHGRSRNGRHDEPSETFRFLGSLAPLPAVKPPAWEKTIDLFAPDMANLVRHDLPFTRVLEERRSLRAYDAQPISVRQLGEFLYRAARVRRLIEPDGSRILYQSSSRPYPSGGACYELELYVAAGRCEGLPVGLYHYDPLGHHLEIVPRGEMHVPDFLRDTRTPVEYAGPRQVLIILSARFQRMTWKYNASTYAAILKNVGVLYQTMYLVATAMRLAPCGLGGGNSELFSRAVGVPFHEETSVGEFMLGSRSPGEAFGV